MTQQDELWRCARLRQVRHLNVAEQDHRRIKRLVRPGMGLKRMATAQPIADCDATAMISKRQVNRISGQNMPTQASFIVQLFRVAA